MTNINITVNKSSLTNAFAVLPKPMKGQIDTYSAYTFSYDGVSLVVTSRNLVAEGSSILPVTIEADQQPIAFSVRADRLKALLWKNQEELAFTLDTETKMLSVKGIPSSVSVEMQAQLETGLVNLEGYKTLPIDKALFDSVKFTADVKLETALGKISYRTNGDIFATDGRVLFAANVDAKAKNNLLIDPRQLALWKKLKGDLYYSVSDKTGTCSYVCTDGYTVLTSSVEAADFPDDPRALFPTGTETFDVSLKDFKEFSMALKNVSDNKYQALLLRNVNGCGSLVASADGVDMAMAISEELPLDGSNIGIALDILKILPSDVNKLSIVPNEQMKPLLFETKKGYEFLVMPVLVRG